MKIPRVLLTACALPQVFAAAIFSSNSTTCSEIARRVEWRTLSESVKAEYIAAVQCLATKESVLGLDSTLYDDFAWVHAKLNLQIHFVAQFLPWHRVFLQLYEDALRSECSYSGLMPYWDWTRDAYHLPSSSLLDPSPSATSTSFGGDGEGSCGFVPPTRPDPALCCVATGPFVDLRPRYLNGNDQPHCLNRHFSNITAGDGWNGQAYAPGTIANITANNTVFETFWQALESGPHGAVHGAVGGDMVPSTSPNGESISPSSSWPSEVQTMEEDITDSKLPDPLFFMHHSQVDRLWWLWQQADPDARNFDFSGNKFAAYTGDDTRAALTDEMTFLGLSANRTVETAMVTDRKGLCYEYV